MIFEVELSERAKEDLREIYEYIAFELMNPLDAGAQLKRLEAAVMSLNQLPERFRKYEKRSWGKYVLHIMPVDNYVVLYTVDKRNRVVHVLRIMYGGRNIDVQIKRL